MEDAVAAQAPERRVRREKDPGQLHWIAMARSLAASLDLLSSHLVLLMPGDPIRVWQANAAARHRFTDCTELALRGGVLQGAPACLEAIRQAMRQAGGHRRGIRHGFEFDLAGGRARATLQALDFGASADLPIRELLLLEIHDPPPAGQGLQLLCARFGLTPKEGEVAIGLYSMGSVDAVARCTGRSVHTIRSQIKAVMQKTGRRTQAALVATVADCLSAAH